MRPEIAPPGKGLNWRRDIRGLRVVLARSREEGSFGFYGFFRFSTRRKSYLDLELAAPSCIIVGVAAKLLPNISNYISVNQ